MIGLHVICLVGIAIGHAMQGIGRVGMLLTVPPDLREGEARNWTWWDVTIDVGGVIAMLYSAYLIHKAYL